MEIDVSTTPPVIAEEVVGGSTALIAVACGVMSPNACPINFPNPALEPFVSPTFEDGKSWSTYPSTPTLGLRLTTLPDIATIGLWLDIVADLTKTKPDMVVDA